MPIPSPPTLALPPDPIYARLAAGQHSLKSRIGLEILSPMSGAWEARHATIGDEEVFDSLLLERLNDLVPRFLQVQEVSEQSKALLEKPFSPSHINQMLSTLASAGLIYKNRHGRYSFAVPLLDRFIRRQAKLDDE